MNPNSYRVHHNDEVDATDIAALLDELKAVGGTLEDPKGGAGGRPLSVTAVRRGTVGGTNVLTEQQRSGAAAFGLHLRRRSTGSINDGATDPRHPSSGAAVGSLAPIGFSTYDPAEAAMMDAQLQKQLQPQLSAAPLGVRLTPLTSLNSAEDSGRGVPSPSGLLPSPPKRPHLPGPLPDSPTSTRPSAGPAVVARAARRPSLNSQTPLPPLPSLANRKRTWIDPDKGGETTNPSAASVAVGGGGGPVHLKMLPAGDTDGTSTVLAGGPSPTSAAAGGQAVDGGNSAAAREINFMPIMCARYLRPVGLTPAARWGHTLTPITPDTMLLFGGIGGNDADTGSLISFNPTTIAWEPLYAMTDTPAARHSHAACAYDSRYLVISGGVAQNGGRVLDDMHLYDTYTHHWRCVWSGERDGSPQNRSEPGPRFGHSIVLHEDRLFLYGGKTVATDEAGRAGGRRRGSTTNSPSKAAGSSATSVATAAAAVLASGSDVHVFSLNSFRWRRRLHCGKARRVSSVSADAAGVVASTADPNVSGEEQGGRAGLPPRPDARAHHAACVRGTTMFINGGAGAAGVLTDTWAVELTTGVWRCIHRGGTADAVPREKHALFACGEALLLVGGCSSGGDLNERITGKFTNFAVVLPLVGIAVETPCWIPVAMGNVSIVSPNKKGFAAALSGGFVYVFGGVCGAEPATNTTIRFLAADGCISENDQLVPHVGGGGGATSAAAAAGAQQLRLMLQQLREQQRGTPYDTYAYAGTYGSVTDIASVMAQLPAPGAGVLSEDGRSISHPMNNHSISNHNNSVEAHASGADLAVVGLHRAIVQQRAPLFMRELEQCRSDLYRGASGAGAGSVNNTPEKPKRSAQAASIPNNPSNDASGDEVDALLREFGGGGGASAAPPNINVTPSKGEGKDSRSRDGGAAATEGLPVYFTNGTARVSGLTQPLAAEALQCLTDYIYWGGLRGKYRVLLEEEKDEAEGGGGGSNSTAAAGGGGAGNFSSEYRNQLVQTLQTVKAAAVTYTLDPLQELCASLLSGNREAMHVARQRCGEQLRADLAALLNSPANANTTMLVVDPHTKAQAAHVLHSSVLMAASGLFAELLRPLYRASGGCGNSKASNQVGPLAAKLSATAAQSPTTLLTSTSKRTVLIGPVPLPLPAVRPILRYLYTQELQVSGELAFEVMLGAHQLRLTELQSLCEAVVAREEVNYQTCCTFYYLSRKYQASLLEEIALLTAVSGFASVRYTAAYQSLSDEEKQNIDAVAAELGSSSWVPPTQLTQEIKSKAVYAARWNSSAPM